MSFFSNAINRFCRKHPRFGIQNLMRYIVIGNVLVYLLCLMDTTGSFANYFTLSPDWILKGQIWRIVTFLFLPIDSNPLFFALSLYFYYWIGSTLERHWGTAQFTLYYILGALFTILLGFVYYFITGVSAIALNASYINLSMFFAFATLFPDMQILLFFIIPVKIKWFALLNAAWFLYSIFASRFPYNLLPILGILNYLLFCGSDLSDSLRSVFRRNRPRRRPINMKQAAKRARKETAGKSYSRKCAVCGKTDKDYPDLEFRYCSRCKGFHCFCIEHINHHVHFME